MSRLKKMKPEVEDLLFNYPPLRDDDFLLVGAVYNRYYGIGHDARFLDVMKNHGKYDVPSFETITRVRRKLQEENPKLRGTKDKEKERQIAFDEFYEFAKGGA